MAALVSLAGCAAELADGPSISPSCAAAARHLSECFGHAVAPAAACDPALAEAIAAEPCPETSDGEKIDGLCNHCIDRWVMAQVASRYMRPRGLEVTATLLEHALQDAPPPLVASELLPLTAADPDDLDSGDTAEQATDTAMRVLALTAEKVRDSAELDAVVARLDAGAYDDLVADGEGWRGPIDDPIAFPSAAEPASVGVPEFRSDDDLFSAYQHVQLFVRVAATGERQLRLRDNYDMRWQRIETGSVHLFLATLGANLAYIEQRFGVLLPYDIELAMAIDAGE